MRKVDLFFGAIFFAIGILIATEASELRQWIAFVAVSGLGLEAMIRGWRGEKSLLSRVGPLP